MFFSDRKNFFLRLSGVVWTTGPPSICTFDSSPFQFKEREREMREYFFGFESVIPRQVSWVITGLDKMW